MEYNRTEQNRMDYKNGKIYVLRSHQTEDIYIGSTTTKLSKRFHKHKKDFKVWKNGKRRYISSFELIKYDDVYIQLLELCPCDSKMELERREGQLIRSVNCVNKNVAGRTQKEWRDDNKDTKKEYNKEYYQENKEILKEKHKESREEYKKENKDKINQKFNCECGGKYTHNHKSRHLKSKKHLSKIPIINVVQELV